ncbi:hypothetical protein POPTR_014G003451v4 [Populus trichocarpa]|uniref:Uncharacterized protein n=1 Tax=Populus trichocarpa TaxID=3694 RepID=A0ACC0RXX6_POPTR|nr:hypothetical protein POPTR_014G003451v4 [Populus trichocarpa]
MEQKKKLTLQLQTALALKILLSYGLIWLLNTCWEIEMQFWSDCVPLYKPKILQTPFYICSCGASPPAAAFSLLRNQRIYINGMPRLKHLNKFSHSLKLKLSPSNSSFRRPHVKVCFYR